MFLFSPGPTELENGSPDLPLRHLALELVPQDELDGYCAGRATGFGTHRPVRPLVDAANVACSAPSTSC
jgi:hypothetical protein